MKRQCSVEKDNMRGFSIIFCVTILTILFVRDLNAQTDIWRLAKNRKNNYSLLMLYNISHLDTITLKVCGVTLFDKLTISLNDTVNCKGQYGTFPLFYVQETDNIPHFFEIDINGCYGINYVIWHRTSHKVKKICNVLDSSEKYLNFTGSAACGSYEVEVVLNGNRYVSIMPRDKRFCYLRFFDENGRRSVKFSFRSIFYGLE